MKAKQAEMWFVDGFDFLWDLLDVSMEGNERVIFGQLGAAFEKLGERVRLEQESGNLLPAETLRAFEGTVVEMLREIRSICDARGIVLPEFPIENPASNPRASIEIIAGAAEILRSLSCRCEFGEDPDPHSGLRRADA